jgi:hypothetical protein
MSSKTINVLGRAVLYSLLSALAAAIIYMIINLATGGKLNGDSLLGSLFTGLISFVIALVFFSAFMLYFSRKQA